LHSRNTDQIGIAQKLPTGSEVFDEFLGGGLSTCCVSDIFGAAATGKTQFAFQSAMFTARRSLDAYSGIKPAVIFVDCAGSFRPERIAEMAEARSVSESRSSNGTRKTSDVLSRISSIYVRSVSEQQEACDLILHSESFSNCKLIVVDDVTTNFVAEFLSSDGADEDTGEQDKPSPEGLSPDFVSRHYEISKYARTLAHIALKKRASVLLTNSVRSRFSENSKNLNNELSQEVETTGEVLSQFSLFRLHFSRSGNLRHAELASPFLATGKINFRIEREGIVP
jgi:DNA repair protein RadA